MEHSSGEQSPQAPADDDSVSAELVSVPSGPSVPPPLDDDEDVLDAEIVETEIVRTLPSSPFGSLTPDYSEAGVPSLDYVRDKIEGRYATAVGSSELAEAAAAREAIDRAAGQEQAAITAEQLRAAREQAGKDKLEEIRRSLHP